jgi:hypothetical protein
MEKLLSGKFILTVIAGAVFAYCAVTKILPPDKVNEIILIIVYAYFTKRETDRQGGDTK